jgi:hypothetical protein
MRKWFKYAGMFLLLCVVIAFFGRERFSMETREPPEKPAKLLVPYGNVLYTEGDEEEVDADVGNDLPTGKD